MNYKSQLKGWAVDRVVEAKRAGLLPETLGLDEMMSEATRLAEYAYVPREDLQSTAKDLFELVRGAPSGESSIDALLGTLEHIKAERIAEGIDKGESIQ